MLTTTLIDLQSYVDKFDNAADVGSFHDATKMDSPTHCRGGAESDTGLRRFDLSFGLPKTQRLPYEEFKPMGRGGLGRRVCGTS